MKADRLGSVPARSPKMQPIVIKRDGCQVPFDEVLIKQAVQRAAIAAGIDSAEYCGQVARIVAENLQDQTRVDIHEIQDAVEKPADGRAL